LEEDRRRRWMMRIRGIGAEEAMGYRKNM